MSLQVQRVRPTIFGAFLVAASLVFLLLPLTWPRATAQNPVAGPQEAVVPGPLFKQVVANQEHCEKLLDEYQRVVRSEVRRPLDGTIDTKYWLAFPMGTGAYKIALPDGKSPAQETYRSDLEKLEKYLAWLIQDGVAQKEAYAKAEHKKKERTDLLEATFQAFLFTREGDEQRQGRTLQRYSIQPNPRFKPTTRNSTLFTKVRGTVWIDEQSSQMAKIDGVVTDDISLALFLGKIYKGSHFMQERYEVAPNFWGPTFEQYDFDGRKFLSSFSLHERTFYTAYKHIGPPPVALDAVRAELNKIAPAATGQ